MTAWDRLLSDETFFHGKGRFSLPAYSEFMPPPWVGRKPYGTASGQPNPRVGDHGWAVSEYEQAQELLPGLEYLARKALAEVVRLGLGGPPQHLTRARLAQNPCWPAELAAHAGKLLHERYVLLLPVALSRTQDDKGRVRWTLFGSSEQGPARPFWRGFFSGPGQEQPPEATSSFFAELLSRCYGVPEKTARNPGRAGLRVLPCAEGADWDDGPLPAWAEGLLYRSEKGHAGVRFLLTFRPFASLPTEVQDAYVRGELHLLPFPGSLAFWGMRGFRKLSRQLPFALQLPLLPLFDHFRGVTGIRIPQTGLLHEKTGGPMFIRTHRWQKLLRDQDELEFLERGSPVTRVLFSTEEADIELYNKPMGRNAQIWSRDHRLVLDGPRHGPARLSRAERLLDEGGTFGYRFIYPAMRVCAHEVYWQRPLVAFGGEYPMELPDTSVRIQSAPLGYLTAYRADRPDLGEPIELWPVLLERKEHTACIRLFAHEKHPRPGQTTANVRALLEWNEVFGEPLPASLARALLTVADRTTLEGWLGSLPAKASDQAEGEKLVAGLREAIATEGKPPVGESLTYARTATREFEEGYWRTIATLAHGRFRTKSVADCVKDGPTRSALAVRKRELNALAAYLVGRHAETIARSGVEGAWVGEHRYSWRTDYEFAWMGGWSKNQRQRDAECNVLVRIPGRDSRQAVILADHYDTAYMHDRYYFSEGGTGARLAAAGADDNYSATAMLLLGAPVLLELSKAGLLGCDVWLVHLNGEEFPSDCLGARHLCQDLVQKTLRVRTSTGPVHDLSEVRVRGVYVADMIAHNNERSRYVFQISPGGDSGSARLARVAHEATEAWNAQARAKNRVGPRRGSGPATRSDDPDRIPPLTAHAVLRGEVRLDWAPRSTLFNTDGQVFSDVGVPVVLFMEDYDIDRKGYHDMHDTMGNIDLDYGAALAAIGIESAAQATR